MNQKRRKIRDIYLTNIFFTSVKNFSSSPQDHPQVTFNKRHQGYRTVPSPVLFGNLSFFSAQFFPVFAPYLRKKKNGKNAEQEEGNLRKCPQVRQRTSAFLSKSTNGVAIIVLQLLFLLLCGYMVG